MFSAIPKANGKSRFGMKTTAGRLTPKLILLVMMIGTVAGTPLAAQIQADGLAFEFSLGTQGILSFEEVGIRLPLMGTVFIDVKGRFLSSMTWATHRNISTGETVSFHPDTIAGILSIGGVSPSIAGLLRAYGGMDLLLGWSFTPWDSLFYGCGNLLGDNLTYAIFGYFGLELFTAPKLSVFLDVGGGLKNLYVEASRKTDPYVVCASWLGSGFGLKMGMKFYL
jgi:hypothetical protein